MFELLSETFFGIFPLNLSVYKVRPLHSIFFILFYQKDATLSVEYQEKKVNIINFPLDTILFPNQCFLSYTNKTNEFIFEKIFYKN